MPDIWKQVAETIVEAIIECRNIRHEGLPSEDGEHDGSRAKPSACRERTSWQPEYIFISMNTDGWQSSGPGSLRPCQVLCPC